ncbi:MAG TPA: Na+/H+ antiporter NhaC family protein [Syntrophomonadaceae bacterium]|nr:Na+/H+ antiporter NhaC family protein [Syntrophomonadaceae bacterium]
MDYTCLSLVPPLVTLAIAFATKRVIPSLTLGLLAGSMLVSKGIFTGVIRATDYIVSSLATRENAYIVLFLYLFGSLVEIIKLAGGIKGFSVFAEKFVKDEKGVLLSVWIFSLVTFMDCCFHAVATGAICRPLLEKVKGSKEKLAMVINITSSQLVVLIPVATTYVGYITGVITEAMRKAGIAGSGYELYLKSLPFNFFSIGMVLLSFLVIYFGLGFGKFRIGKGLKITNIAHSVRRVYERRQFEEMAKPRALNLLLPAILIISLFFLLFWWTGRGNGRAFFQAVMNAEFARAIFIATFITIIITAFFYILQKIPAVELENHFLNGGSGLVPPIILLILSWSLSNVTQDLGFIDFVSKTFGTMMPRLFIPAAIFLIGGLTSYFIGSSWATWGLIMPLALPLAVASGTTPHLVIGAVLAGGSIGDSVSPLGENPVLTATVTDVPIVEHMQTILPYAAIITVLCAILYVVAQAFL